MSGMRKVNVVGKIINLFPVREYSKNGREGKVANFVIADDTGSTRVVLWDVNHIALIEDGTIKEGDVVEIRNGATRDMEIHLSGFSELKKSATVMDDVKTGAVTADVSLAEAKQGQSVRVRGSVVQVFQPRFYKVCSNCNRKAVQEGEVYKCRDHGVVTPGDRAILNFVLDDGTETMRVVMFSDQIKLVVPEEDLHDEAKAVAFRDDFIGTEIYLSGNVKKNQMFENLEIVASGVEKVDVEKLISELDK
jgi:ssDNA-binding replication factor A large subunit